MGIGKVVWRCWYGCGGIGIVVWMVVCIWYGGGRGGGMGLVLWVWWDGGGMEGGLSHKGCMGLVG